MLLDMLRIIILFAIPYVLLVLFTYKSYMKLPTGYDVKLTRRVYYLFVILYIAALTVFCDDTLKSINVFDIKNAAISYIVNIALLFLVFTAWEYIFISCKTFKTIKFKDTELTFDDLSSVQYADKLQEKENDNLYAVLNAVIKVKKYIDEYLEKNTYNYLESYKDIIKEYENKRQDVSIYVCSDNKDGLSELQREQKLSEQELSSIFYSVNMFGFSIPKQFRKDNYIFARLKTKYLADNIIIVLRGKMLIDKENLVLADILNYFEVKMTLELEKGVTE